MVIEVVSSNDGAEHLRDKLALFRAAGTRLIWMIYPSLRRVDIHHADGTSCEAGLADQLDGGDVLPRLRIKVADLFPSVWGGAVYRTPA